MTSYRLHTTPRSDIDNKAQSNPTNKNNQTKIYLKKKHTHAERLRVSLAIRVSVSTLAQLKIYPIFLFKGLCNKENERIAVCQRTGHKSHSDIVFQTEIFLTSSAEYM